jgi:serralysin
VRGSPLRAWITAAGGWGWARSKLTAGDFDGDGKSEVAILYDYGNDTTALFLFNSESTAARATWITAAGGLGLESQQAHRGDFNGDGRSEIAIFYDYGNDNSGLAYFNSEGTAAQRVFLSGAGNWSWARSLLGG